MTTSSNTTIIYSSSSSSLQHQPMDNNNNNDENDGGSPPMLPVGWVVVAVVGVGVMVVTAVGGNGMVVLSYRRDRQLRDVHNLYLLHLAVCDLMLGAVSMPLYLVYTVLGRRWPMGRAVCKVFLVEDFTLCCLSTLLVILLAWDTLTLLNLGLHYQAVETRKRAYTKLAVCWVSSFLLYSPAILFWDVVRGRSIVAPDDCDVEFADNVIFVVITEVVSFSVPFVSLTVLNVLIFMALKKRRRTRQSLDSKPRQTVTKIHDRESDCQTVTKIPDRESDCQTVTKIPDRESDCQTVTKIPDRESDCQTVTKIRDTDSKECQTITKIRDTDPKECQTVTKIPDRESDCQTVTKIRDTDSKECQTITKIRDTDPKECQTITKIRNTDPKECQTITKIRDTDPKECQTITKIRDTDSKECETVTKIRDTDSKECQTTFKWYGACAVVSFNKRKVENVPESSNSKCRLLNKINPRQGSSDSSISHGVETFSSRMLKPGTRNSCDKAGICVSGSKPELRTFSLLRASDLPNQSQKPPPFQTPFPSRQFHHSSVSQTSVSTIQSQMSPHPPFPSRQFHHSSVSQTSVSAIQSQMSPHPPDPASTNPQQTPTPSEPSHQPSLFQTNVNHSQIHPHAETSSGRRGREKESEEKRERRVAMILVGLVVALVVFWLPYSLTTILLVACSDCVNADAYDVFNWMLWMKSCVNPFLYAYNSPRFRHNFQELLCHLLPARLLRKSKMTLNGTSRANTQ